MFTHIFRTLNKRVCIGTCISQILLLYGTARGCSWSYFVTWWSRHSWTKFIGSLKTVVFVYMYLQSTLLTESSQINELIRHPLCFFTRQLYAHYCWQSAFVRVIMQVRYLRYLQFYWCFSQFCRMITFLVIYRSSIIFACNVLDNVDWLRPFYQLHLVN